MNTGLHHLEIIAVLFGLASLAILSALMIAGYRFNHKVRTTRRIDPHEQKRLKRWLIVGLFLSGICMAVAGLSLSLWSPVGLERLTLYEVLFSFSLCGGSGAVTGALLYLYTIRRWQFLLRYLYKQERPDDSRRDEPNIDSNTLAQE